MNVNDSVALNIDGGSVPLFPVRLDGEWNGFAVPVVTAAEFRRWLYAMAAVEPGEWRPESLAEESGVLIYDDGQPDTWRTVGEHDGAALYALDGWTWHLRLA